MKTVLSFGMGVESSYVTWNCGADAPRKALQAHPLLLVQDLTGTQNPALLKKRFRDGLD